MQDNFAYLLPFIMATFGVLLLCFKSPGFPAARFWGAGYICAALGFAAPALFRDNAFTAHALIANALFFGAFFLYGHALLTQFSAPSHFRIRLILALAAYAVVAFFILVKTDLRTELAIADLVCAGLLAPALWLVRGKIRHRADRALAIITACVVAELLLRVAVLLAFTENGSMQSLELFLHSDYAYYMQVTASIFGFLMGLAVIASVTAHVLRQHRHAAEHDPLTGLLNRRGFDARTPNFTGAELPSGAVIAGDIDHFKQVNDLFGHAAGDGVIVAFGALLRAQLPRNARIARFGGEEFVAFLPAVSAAEAAVLCNMARMALAAHDWRGEGIDRQITASFGVSAASPGDRSLHDAIARADRCLYRAKESGRNRVVQESAADGGEPLLHDAQRERQCFTA